MCVSLSSSATQFSVRVSAGYYLILWCLWREMPGFLHCSLHSSDTARLLYMPAFKICNKPGAVICHNYTRPGTGRWLAAHGYTISSSRQPWRRRAAEVNMDTAGASGVTGDSYTVSAADQKFFEANG